MVSARAEVRLIAEPVESNRCGLGQYSAVHAGILADLDPDTAMMIDNRATDNRVQDDYAIWPARANHGEIIRRVRAGYYTPLIQSANLCRINTVIVPREDFEQMLEILASLETTK